MLRSPPVAKAHIIHYPVDSRHSLPRMRAGSRYIVDNVEEDEIEEEEGDSVSLSNDVWGQSLDEWDHDEDQEEGDPLMTAYAI